MKQSKILFFCVLILSVFGLVMVYSASSIWSTYKFGNPYRYLIHQLLFLCVGIILCFIVSKIDYRIYKDKSNLILFICFLLLVLVLIPGLGKVRNGSRSWFGIGSFGIQPSEIAKIGLTIFISKYLSKNDNIKRNERKFIIPILLIIMLFFGLIMLEPDFGTGMVIVVSLMALIFISGANFKIFIKLGILGLLGICGLILVAPYRLKRIISFLDPWTDPLGSGFQIIQSLYAIGPGGLLGQGFLSSRQKYFYLPEPQTDFIFSIITEEFGFVGALFVCAMYFLIIFISIRIALKQTDLFAKYLSMGLIIMFGFQTILNLLVIVGLVPVTGVTLPFLSYGGSSLITSMISIGIILNVSKNNS